MDSVHFHQLNTLDISFYNLASIIPNWKDGSIDNYLKIGRNENMLFYMIHGKRSYSIDEKEFLKIKDGDILFFPKSSRYLSKLKMGSLDEISTGICIKFDIKDEKGNEVVLNDSVRWIAYDFGRQYYQAFFKIHETIMLGMREKLYSKALLSQLMDTLISNVRKDELFDDASLPIYPAIRKIERYPQDAISIAELADMCFLSESTFRRKFKQYTSTTPTRYRNKIRIKKAIQLIKSGIYTIEQTAEVMGFTDQAHLSNMIKKHTGKTPKEIVLLTNQNEFTGSPN